MSLSEEDLNLLRGVVKTITSERYKDKNYVFLHPFDLSQTPGYLDVVKNTMDLETLSKNLEAGMYTSQQAFFKDCFTTFENAVAYHGNRKESKWIAKLGKEMLKVAKREEKILEKKKQPPVAAGGSGKQPGKSMILPTKKNEKSAAEAESQNEGGATKLKLKLGGPKSAPAPISKPKIKLGLAKQPTEEQASAAESGEVKKPKLKLKLGLKLKPSSSPTPLESTSDKKANSKPSDNPSTPKSASSGSGKISIKMTGAGAGSRGKELPAGVSPPKAEPKKTAKKNTSKKTTKKEKSPSPTPDAKHAASKSKKPKISLATNRITPDRKAQCAKVLNGLKRRKVNDVWLFLQPVSDKNILIDYKAKIENPMDLQTMETKLEKNQYQTVGDFVLDLRRILSNCLRYNTSSKTGLRQVAVNVLTAAEELCTVFLAKKENPSVVYQPLLYCWKTCNNILDALFNLINPGDGQQTALYFFHPVPVYTGGQWPDDYLAKVKKPMDFGTVTRDLIEGTYASFEEFEADCRLVVDNCITYYGGKADGKIFTDQANRLKTLLQQQIEKTKKYLKSPAGTSLKTQSQLAITTATFPKPPIPLLLKVIEEMRALKYTDKATKVSFSSFKHA